jgi:hypothetical protein
MLARGSGFVGQNDFVCGCRESGSKNSFYTTNNVKRNIARF